MTKSVQRGRKATKKTTSRKAARKDSSAPLTRNDQSALYGKAMKLVNSGDFARAKDMLEQVMKGPSPEITHAARMHKSACERRLAADKVELDTPEDHYNYAISLINRRRLDEAREHLEVALQSKEDADHVHYALALCSGMQEDTPGAAGHLARAIEINPRNRTTARSDPDFEPILKEPEIRELLRPERIESE